MGGERRVGHGASEGATECPEKDAHVVAPGGVQGLSWASSWDLFRAEPGCGLIRNNETCCNSLFQIQFDSFPRGAKHCEWIASLHWH